MEIFLINGHRIIVSILQDVISVLAESLQLGEQAAGFDGDTELFGALPEFDSMAVVVVVTALEERFDFVVDDEEITAELFETIGTLATYVESKI